MPDTGHVVTGATTRVGILGWPVGHSRSPAMHNAVHRQLGMDAIYLALPTPPERLAGAIVALRRLGWVGVNVTIPHKVEALAAADRATDEAELIGAANVLHLDEGVLVADNTDARGWSRSVQEAAGWDGTGTAVVLGTGGAARAVVVGAARLGATVTVVGRRAGPVGDLVDLARRAGAPDAAGVDVEDAGAVAAVVGQAAVVVNATPLGMQGEQLPGAFQDLGAGQVASDLVYTPATTPWLAAVGARGATVVGGLGMLAHQAALAFERWHGIAAPVDAFLAALDRR